MSLALARRRIAVPERRELDVFAQMLERHGANVIRCPLVAIRDVPDPAPVVAWLQRFTSNFPDDFVLLTGSALRAAPAWRRFSLPRLLGWQDHTRPETSTTIASTGVADRSRRRATHNCGNYRVAFQ